MKTGQLRARQRLTLREAGEIVRESFGGRWYEVHDSESFEPRRQAVALIIEAIKAGNLLAEITARTHGFPGDAIGAPDPAKSTVATADLLAWLEGITPASTADAEPAKVGAGGTATETPAERQTRLQERCNELKTSGVKAWKKQTADEERISTSMLDKILRRESIPAKAKPGTIEALKGIGKNNNRC
jgi:hypothetical protein